jgi:hypothetical protein
MIEIDRSRKPPLDDIPRAAQVGVCPSTGDDRRAAEGQEAQPVGPAAKLSAGTREKKPRHAGGVLASEKEKFACSQLLGAAARKAQPGKSHSDQCQSCRFRSLHRRTERHEAHRP